MAEMQWIKLRIDMFDDEKIKIIQSMPDGDAILVVWIRLIALAGKCNANGLVLVEDEFPYTDEMLSVIFNKPLQTVRLALKTFEKFRMIESTVKGIYITNFDKHQNIEGMEKIREQNRVRKQRQRERNKALLLEELPSGSTVEPASESDGNDNVTKEITGLSRDRSCEVTQQREEKEKEYINISSDEDILSEPADKTPVPVPDSARIRIDYRHIMTDFHDTCTDLPTIRAMSEARKRKIRSLLNEFGKLKIWPDVTIYDRLHRLFQMAQESDFLSGRNGRWNGCSFDWLINKTNALKVLEGTYANKGGAGNVRSNTGSTGIGNHNRADSGTIEGTTNEALERFRRNSGIQVPEVP